MRSGCPSKWKRCMILRTEGGDEVEKEGTSQSLVEIQQQFASLNLSENLS